MSMLRTRKGRRLAVVLLCLMGFAAGSVPFGLILALLIGKADIRRMALPLMAKLSHQSGYTVHLGVRDGCEVVYIDKDHLIRCAGPTVQ